MTDTNASGEALEIEQGTAAPGEDDNGQKAAAGEQGAAAEPGKDGQGGEVKPGEGGQQLTPEQEEAERQKQKEAGRRKNKTELRIQDLARQKNYWHDKAMTAGAELEEYKRNPPAVRDRSQYASEADYEADREARQNANFAQQMAVRDAREAETRQASLEKEIWETKIESERDKFPDFEAVAYNPAVSYSDAMIEAVRGHDHGVEIAYHLGKNPEIARRIANLSPLQAAMEIGALGLRFSSASSATPPAKRQTSAPAPIKTLPGSGAGAGSKKFSEMSMEEYAKARGF